MESTSEDDNYFEDDQVMIVEVPDRQEQRADRVSPDQRVKRGTPLRTRDSSELRSINHDAEKQRSENESRQLDLKPSGAPSKALHAFNMNQMGMSPEMSQFRGSGPIVPDLQLQPSSRICVYGNVHDLVV